jgi:transposase
MAKPLVTDELWAALEPLLPPNRPKPKGGRPRASDRAALAGMIFVLRTGIPWEYVPREMGVCGMTCWRLRDWQAAGVWAALHRLLLERLGGEPTNWTGAGPRWTVPLSRRKGGIGDRPEPDGSRQAGHEAAHRR